MGYKTPWRLYYYPPPEQVHAWSEQAGLAIEEEGTGDGYAHFLAMTLPR